MSYEDLASGVVRVIEGVGCGIMIIGGFLAFVCYARQVAGAGSDPHPVNLATA